MDASTASTSSEAARALRRCVAALALLLAIAGVSLAQTPAARRVPLGRDIEDRAEVRRQAPAPAASIFFCEVADVQCRTSINQFDLDDLRDLYVFAAWRNVSGEHVQQLRFVLPDGGTYQMIETKFTTAANPSAAGVQKAVLSRGEPTVVAILPVAGSNITQRSLSGNWIVELSLDGRFVARANLVLRPRQ